MQKINLPLSSLKPHCDPLPPKPPCPDCETIRDEVNKHLLDQCSQKFHTLPHCNDCDITNQRWSVINSPLDAKLLNTSYNGNGGYLPQGSRDSNWEVGLGTPSSFPSSWIPAHVRKFGSAWVSSPFTNADWISLYDDDRHTGNQDVYFKIRFYLNNSIFIANFAMDMDFYADNSVYEIYVNGVPQSTHQPSLLPQGTSATHYTYRGFDAGEQVRISLAHDWLPCENEIIVHVKSGGPAIGFLAQCPFRCYPSNFPELTPTINISWGDSKCDCFETDDVEVLCITVCNSYSDVTFKNFVIGKIIVVDEFGNPVPTLPDGTPSVDLHPIGPYCFGNIGPCDAHGPKCVAREFVMINRGARAGKYRIVIEGICFEVCKLYTQCTCFEVILCKS